VDSYSDREHLQTGIEMSTFIRERNMSGSDDTGGYAVLIFFRASAITPNNIPIIVYNAKANSL